MKLKKNYLNGLVFFVLFLGGSILPQTTLKEDLQNKYKLGQYEEAIRDFDRAIDLNNSSAYNNRGSAKYDLGQYWEAIRDFDRAIESNPNNSMAITTEGVQNVI